MARSEYTLLSVTRGLFLVFLAVAWMAGILIDSILQIAPQPCLLLSSLFLLLLIIFWSDQRYRLLLLLCLCISLGAWHYAWAQPRYDPQSVDRLIGTSSALSIRGTVTDEPKLQTRTRLLMISVDAVQRNGNSQWEHADGTIEVITLYQGSSPEDPYGANYGDSVKLQGKLQSPTPTSPKNVVASMGFPRIHVSATGGNPLIASIYRLRNQLAILIEQALPQPEAALLIGILLGLRTPALNLLASAFKVTGTTHLLVSSGSNVTIISGLVYRATQYLSPKHTGSSPLIPLHKSWSDRIRTILLLLSITLYTVLSGAGPASLRAGIMGGLLVIAPGLGRRYNVYTGLAVAVILMSCMDPFLLWDVGFQLSFLATLGIVFLTPYLQRLMQPIARLPAGSLIVEMTAVTLAAQIATLPILAVAFRQTSLISLIANLLVAPLPGPLMLLGLVIDVTGLVFHPLSLLCGWIAWPLLWYMKKVIEICSMVPYAFIVVENIPAFIAWLYYTLLALAISFLYYRYPLSPTKQHPPLLTPRNRRRLYVGSAILIIVTTGINIISPPSTAGNTISFFNIDAPKANGQQHRHGEAIFLRTQDGKTLLIDGGSDIVSLSQLLDNQLSPWQRSLDMVILTSPEQDTITGLQDVLTRYQVGAVFDAGMAHPTTAYARWRRMINERHLQYMPVVQGTTLSLGTTTQLQVLWPQDRLHTGSNEIRDNGLMLRLVMPGFRLLLLGSSIQSNYALSGLLASVDENMLKTDSVQMLGEMNTPVPAALSDVLQRAQPSLVVITSSTEHKSSQSTNKTRSTLSSALVAVPQVLQTAQQGTLELYSDSTGWTMSEGNVT
jgi:ComEC/Rec2-related protein